MRKMVLVIVIGCLALGLLSCGKKEVVIDDNLVKETTVVDESKQSVVENEPSMNNSETEETEKIIEINKGSEEYGRLLLQLEPYHDNYNILGVTSYTVWFYIKDNNIKALVNTSYNGGRVTDTFDVKEIDIPLELYNLIETSYYEKEISAAEWNYILGYLANNDIDYVNMILCCQYWDVAPLEEVLWVSHAEDRGSLILTTDTTSHTRYKITQIFFDTDKDTVETIERVTKITDATELNDFISILFHTRNYIDNKNSRGEDMYNIMQALLQNGIDGATKVCLDLKESY